MCKMLFLLLLGLCIELFYVNGNNRIERRIATYPIIPPTRGSCSNNSILLKKVSTTQYKDEPKCLISKFKI